MLKSIIVFLRSFPLKVIVWKIYCRLSGKKIPNLKSWQQNFVNKTGIEIGGPSGIFNTTGYLPLYNIASGIDGVNFSNSTVWEGKIYEGYNYKYHNKTGYQFISEGSNLSKIKDNSYDFLLSSNNLEHIANPIRAVLEWKRIINWNGVLLLILPNKDANFDHARPYTTMDHLIDDFNKQTGEDDLTHLEEIIRLHDLRRDPQAKSFRNFEIRCHNNFKNRCMHHHVFNQNLMKQLLQYCDLKVMEQYSNYTDHFILGKKAV
jgi:SAM-dependent methyltransferase